MSKSRWRVCVDSLTPIRNLAGDLLDTADLRRWRFDRPTRHRLLLGCRRASGSGSGFALAPEPLGTVGLLHSNPHDCGMDLVGSGARRVGNDPPARLSLVVGPMASTPLSSQESKRWPAGTSKPAPRYAICARRQCGRTRVGRSEEHTSELQSPCNLVCRLLLEKKK